MEYVYYDNFIENTETTIPYLSMDYVSWKYISKYIDDVDNTFYKNHAVLYTAQTLYVRTSHIIKDPYLRFASCYIIAGKLLEELLFHIDEFTSITGTNKRDLLNGEKRILEFIYNSDFCILRDVFKKYSITENNTLKEKLSSNSSDTLIDTFVDALIDNEQSSENINVANYKGWCPSCFTTFPKMQERLLSMV